MSQSKLSKKYIGSEQVGSVQIELENELALRAKTAEGQSEELLKLDEENQLQLLKHPYLPGAATEPEQAARKQEVDEVASDLEALEGRVEGAEGSIDDLEGRVEALEVAKEVVEVESFADLALIADPKEEVIYVTKDTNKIYRLVEGQFEPIVLPEAPAAPELVVTTSITDQDDLQATINAANDGDVIFLANGTYTYAGLSIAKQIALVGESQAGVLLQDSRANSQTFMNISVNNVTLKDLTIRHATTDSSIGIAIAASGGGFPQVRLNNFKMYNVKSQYSKGGLSVRSDNFVVEGCTFEVVAGSSTRRGILHYGNGGDSFIKNNHFINATTGALRAICPTSTSGSNPSDDQAGSLTIEGSTFTGNLSQFVNMDNHQGQSGAFELIVKDNVTPETNAFVVSFGGAANFGDLFSRVILIGNNLTNSHSLGLGKGIFGIDAASLVSFRSSSLPIIAIGNVLGQTLFRSGWAEASGSMDGIAGYNTVTIAPQPVVEVSDELGIQLPNSFAELSATDLSPIEADLGELEQRLSTVEGEVTSLEGALGEEIQNRITADEEVLSDAKAYADSQDALKLTEAKEYTDEKIADLIGTAPELLDTLGEIAEALQNEQTATGAILEQLSDHEARIETLEGDFSSLEPRVETLESKVSVLEEDSAGLRTDVDDLFGTTFDLRTDVDDLFGRTFDLRSDLDALILSVDSGLSDRVTALEQSSEQIQTDLSQAQSDIAALQGAVSALEGSVSQIQSDLSQVQASVSALEEAVATDLAEAIAAIEAVESDVNVLIPLVSSLQDSVADLQSEDLKFLKLDGSREMEGALDMGGFKISDLADPSAAQDAATKAYVDSVVLAGTDFEVQKIVLSQLDIINQYVDLEYKAALGSVIVSSERVNLIAVLGADADADFIHDNTGAVTRLVFQGPSADDGESALVEGQIMYVNYVKAI